MSCKTSANPQATIEWYEENLDSPGDVTQANQITPESGIKFKLGVQDNDNKPFSTSSLSVSVLVCICVCKCVFMSYLSKQEGRLD